MRTFFITAALLSATAMPAAAMAQQTCQEHSNKRAIGTVAGAGVGGVLGNIIAGSGDKTLGTIIGAVGGGVLGNQVTKDKSNCNRAYGWYDKSGTWRAGTGQASAQTGYYDREGNWVEGAPRGYYDNQGRWIAANGTQQVGYRDSNGRWVAGSAQDYGNQNRVGMVPGYWQNGRWIPGETTGSYDSRGRWIAGQPSGRRDANGNWIADAQPGYYDSRGRWIAGEATGSYDSRGRWIASNAYNNGGNNDAGYNNGGNRDVRSRLARIEQRIDRGVQQGSLTPGEARRAEDELAAIRRYDRSLRTRSGTLTARNEALVQARLDRLSDRIKAARDDG